MCGRFALYSPYPKLSESLCLTLELRKLEMRYNAVPGTWITAVRRPGDEVPLDMDEVWWGYRPYWAKEKAPEFMTVTVGGLAAFSITQLGKREFEEKRNGEM
ncbi:MAG: SOS response-associated peptidase family protein [Pseudomonadota bacterium]